MKINYSISEASLELHKNETKSTVDSWAVDWLVQCNTTIKRAKYVYFLIKIDRIFNL